MSTKIVFNGQEYDGVESMPEEARRQYEAALNALSAEERGRLEAAGQGAHVQFKVNVRRTYKIGGKEYDSVEAMPPDVRAAFERAAVSNPALRDTASSIPTLRPSDAGPVVPPAIDAGDSRRARMFRIAFWVVVGLAVAVWLLSRR
jgi:hypothetical protein